jgi:outer membrane receptor protein involved in Fe transport
LDPNARRPGDSEGPCFPSAPARPPFFRPGGRGGRGRLPFLAIALSLGLAASAQEPEGGKPEENAEESKPPESGPPKSDGSDLLQPDAAERTGLVISATRLARPDEDIPRATNLIDPVKLWRENPRSVPAALRRQPGIMVQSTEYAGGSPSIRGLIGQQVLLVVDGVRVNNSIFRFGPNQYLGTLDPFIVDRIEVVRGPGSVLYGSDALGGTIALFTRHREDFDEPQDAHARAKARGATADRSFHLRAETEGNLGAFGWLVGGSARWRGDLDGGDHTDEQPFTGYDDFAGDVHLDLKLDEHWLLRGAALALWQINAPRSDQLFVGYRGTGSNRFAEFHRTWQRLELGYVKLEARDLGGLLDGLEIAASANHQSELRHIRRTGSTVLQRDEDSVLTAGLSAALSSKAIRWNTITLGVEGYYDWVNSDTESRDQATGVETAFPPRGAFADDSTDRTLAVYLQDEFRPNDWLSLVAGARFSHIKVDIEELDPVPGDDVDLPGLEKTFTAVSWDLHGNVRLPIPDLNLWAVAGVSRGFRAPNIDDFSAFQETGSSFDVPNRDIHPETLVQYEVGLKGGNEKWKGSLFGFKSHIHGLITRQDVTFGGSSTSSSGKPFKARDNSDEASVYGVELDLEVEVCPHVRPFVVFTYIAGHDRDRDEVIRRMPPTMAAYGVRYEEKKWFVEGWLESARTQDRLSADDRTDARIPKGGTPGWTTANLRGGYEFTERIKATISVENLFDIDHRYHGSGVNEPGLNATMSLEFGF